MISVKVPRVKKAIKVTVEVANTGQLISTNPIAVTSLPQSVTRRLDRLTDVDALNELEGGVPRYDAGTDKYIVEKLDISDLIGTIGKIDAGEF
jgi:hypothetical protein